MDADSLQAISSILSVIIAVVALYTAIRSEQRANEQFRENTRLQREVVELSHKPVLHITFNRSTNAHGIILNNVGNGTAVITKTSFKLEGREHHNITDVIKFPDEELSIYDSTYLFHPARTSYLQAGQTMTVALVTRAMFENVREKLQGQNGVTGLEGKFDIDDAYIENVLISIRDQLENLAVHIEYHDILGNAQPPCSIG